MKEESKCTQDYDPIARLFLNFSSIIHSPKPMSNNQNVCVLKGWPHFHVDQWPRWNYVSMFWDLECNYPIGSIQHRSNLNVWFIADWWLVYFDLQFNLDLCLLVFSIPHICHGRHGQRLCKFFLPGVNFYRFNAKNWQFTV